MTQHPGLAAGWSSPVARQAHNLKVAGSNPAPAPKHHKKKPRQRKPAGLFAGHSLGPEQNSAGAQSRRHRTRPGRRPESRRRCRCHRPSAAPPLHPGGDGAAVQSVSQCDERLAPCRRQQEGPPERPGRLPDGYPLDQVTEEGNGSLERPGGDLSLVFSARKGPWGRASR